jgi:UDP-N-acetylglucosamine acyltransferase
VPKIHPTASVDSGAVVADDATIGPYCVIGPGVTVGAGVSLMAHVYVEGETVIGPRTVVYPFAALGTAPQSTGYKGEPTRLEIGADCQIRESVTMNRGTPSGGGVTRVGDRGFFMAHSHVGHDCIVGNDVIFANSVALGGHAIIGDYVFMGGLAAVHQHTRVGSHVMVGGGSAVLGDAIPFTLINGRKGMIEGLNVVGLRRRGFTTQRLHVIRKFYHHLFLGPGTFAERVELAMQQEPADPGITEILEFIKAGGKRRLTIPRTIATRLEEDPDS